MPCTSTMPQAITSTTSVRIAVPRFDSTPSMPIFPRIAVKLAKMAENTAHTRALRLFCCAGTAPGFGSIIKSVPAKIKIMPPMPMAVTGSPSSRNDRSIVKTVLDLSMGATLLTSPICSARK